MGKPWNGNLRMAGGKDEPGDDSFRYAPQCFSLRCACVYRGGAYARNACHGAQRGGADAGSVYFSPSVSRSVCRRAHGSHPRPYFCQGECRRQRTTHPAVRRSHCLKTISLSCVPERNQRVRSILGSNFGRCQAGIHDHA